MKKFLLFFLVISISATVFAQNFTVSMNDKADFTKIQEAIDQAVFGSYIWVESGIYLEQITLKTGISLIALGDVFLYSSKAGAVVTMADSCTLNGFTIGYKGEETEEMQCGIMVRNVKHSTLFSNFITQNKTGIFVENSDCNVNYNTIFLNKLNGITLDENSKIDLGFNIFLKNTASAINVSSLNSVGMIYNNNFYGSRNAVYLTETSTNTSSISLINNIFYENENAVNLNTLLQDISYNCFFDNKSDYTYQNNSKRSSLNKTNIFQNPRFSDIENNDFSLSENSPCINSGKFGSDIGMMIVRSGNEINAAKKKKWKTQKKYTIRLDGNATNISAGHKSCDISVVVCSDDGEHFLSKGQFDNINLFGYFEMEGIKTTLDNDTSLSIRFDKGKVSFNFDGSGFPINTQMSFTSTMNIHHNSAEGLYFIGIAPPFYLSEQNGKFSFRTVRLNSAAKKIVP